MFIVNRALNDPFLFFSGAALAGARRGSIDMPPLPGFDLDGGSEGRKVIPLKTAKNQSETP